MYPTRHLISLILDLATKILKKQRNNNNNNDGENGMHTNFVSRGNMGSRLGRLLRSNNHLPNKCMGVL